MVAGEATLFVSHGGKIQRSSEDGRLTYVGENRLVKVRWSSSLRELRDRLAAVAGCFNVALQYVRPDDPGELRDIVTDDDVQHVLDWVRLRNLQIQLCRRNLEKVVVVPRVRVIVVSMDVRPPLPEWLFAAAPTTPIAAGPSPSPVPPAIAPVSPSPLQKRSASAPSLSQYTADDTSKPLSPSPIQRSASASRLTSPSTNPGTTATSAATGTLANQEGIPHYAPAAAPFPAMQSGHAPVFWVPVYPSSLENWSASAPSACLADDKSCPSLIQRSAPASSLAIPSSDPITTTSAATSSTWAAQEGILHYATPFPPTVQQGPAPVFLVPMYPSSPQKRSAPAPSLSACSAANDTSKSPFPSLISSESTLTLPSTNPVRTTIGAAASIIATQEDTLHYAAPMQRGPDLVYPAPVFLVPVPPVIVYQPVIPVYHGFLVPARCYDVVVSCAA